MYAHVCVSVYLPVHKRPSHLILPTSSNDTLELFKVLPLGLQV